MKTIIQADVEGRELQPLTERTCRALLPVAGKPVIVYLLEALYRAGIREATVVAGPFADQLTDFLAGGTPWGMQLNVVSQSGFTGIVNDADSREELLMLRGEVLADMDLQQTLKHAREAGSMPAPQFDSVAALVHNNSRLLPLLLPESSINRLKSLQAYHQANMDVLNGRFAYLKPAGMELEDGVYSEPGATIDRDDTCKCKLFVGTSSRLPADTEIDGTAIVGNHVLINRKVRLSNTVILPHTYVGAFTNLNQAIVWGNVLIRVDTGVITRIEDPNLLADITPGNPLKKRGRNLSRRLLPAWLLRPGSKQASTLIR